MENSLRILITGIVFTLGSTCFLVIAEEISTVEFDPMIIREERFSNLGFKAEKVEASLTPGGISLVDGLELRNRNISSLADMLHYVPGVWITSDSGTDGIFFSSRGSNLDATDFDMNGIKLLQDGLSVTTAAGDNHNRIIDPLSARYAIIARGANGLKYGASTLGGAINFVSPTAHDTPTFQLFLNGGSHDQFLGRATVSHIFNERFDGLVTIEGKKWEGFRDHNEQDRYGVYANTGLELSDSVATRFYVSYLDNDQELAGSLTQAQFEDDPDQAGTNALGGNFQLNVETLRLANKTTFVFDENRRLDLGFSYEEQELFHPIVDKVLIDFDGPGPNPPVEVFSLLIDTDHQDIGTMVRYHHRLGKHDLLFGFNYGENELDGEHHRNDGGKKNGLMNFVENDASTLEIYAMNRWHLNENWMLILGAQVVEADREVKSIDPAGAVSNNPDESYSGFNPRVGVIYKVNDQMSLFANVSRLFEAPTNFELEDDASPSGKQLDAMKGTVYEIGMRGHQDFGVQSKWEWELSLYSAKIQDEILSREDPNAPGESLVTNFDNTIHTGIEGLVKAELAFDSAENFTIEPLLSLTINEFEFDDDPTYRDNQLPAAPPYFLRGEVLFRHVNGLYFGPTFEFIDDRYADFKNTFEVDSYALLGLRAGWIKEEYRVFVQVHNILDEEYVANHSVRDRATVNDAILNPGAPLSVFAGAQIEF